MISRQREECRLHAVCNDFCHSFTARDTVWDLQVLHNLLLHQLEQEMLAICSSSLFILKQCKAMLCAEGQWGRSMGLLLVTDLPGDKAEQTAQECRAGRVEPGSFLPTFLFLWNALHSPRTGGLTPKDLSLVFRSGVLTCFTVVDFEYLNIQTEPTSDWQEPRNLLETTEGFNSF